MKICFINSGNAFLPEIEAYVSFFSAFKNVITEVATNYTSATGADVEWYFMGTQHKRSKAITIHEYASSSVPPFGTLKNMIKKSINCKPDYRIFFSEYVAQRFNFNDNIPFGFRGHGIFEEPQYNTNIPKKYDFIYVGTIEKKRKPDSLFRRFTTGSMKHKTLLVLSKEYDEIATRLKDYGNIIFMGPVAYGKVYEYIQQSRFAINFMPDISPYNKQVSSKFIDYIACCVPVISTDYTWVRDFEAKYGGRYFYLDKNLNNFTWENVNNFRYSFPEIPNFSWSNQIIDSGIIRFLQQKFPGSFI
ncbi:MAG: hypothetical protein QM668_16225 [Agriterribacter sp.]